MPDVTYIDLLESSLSYLRSLLADIVERTDASGRLPEQHTHEYYHGKTLVKTVVTTKYRSAAAAKKPILASIARLEQIRGRARGRGI